MIITTRSSFQSTSRVSCDRVSLALKKSSEGLWKDFRFQGGKKDVAERRRKSLEVWEKRQAELRTRRDDKRFQLNKIAEEEQWRIDREAREKLVVQSGEGMIFSSGRTAAGLHPHLSERKEQFLFHVMNHRSPGPGVHHDPAFLVSRAPRPLRRARSWNAGRGRYHARSSCTGPGGV